MDKKDTALEKSAKEIYQEYKSNFLINETVDEYHIHENINTITKKQGTFFFRRRLLGWLTAFFEIHAMDYLLSLSNGGIVLDVPCGTGKILGLIEHKQKFQNTIGIDASKLMIQKQFDENGGNRVLIIADITNLPIRSNTIDIVVCNRFFHRIPPLHHEIALQEIRRICKKDMIVYFSVKPFLFNLIVYIETRFHFGDRGLIYYMTIDQIKKEIIKDEFEYIKGKHVLPLLSNGYLILARRK
jgi:ubiquinone/menaquinone biosynthesis C-methylase UbiE